jgi:hypothetical protein
MQQQNKLNLRTKQTIAYIGLFGCFSSLYYMLGVILPLHNSSVNTFVGAFIAIAIYYFIIKKYIAFTAKSQMLLLAASYLLMSIFIFISLKVL